MINELIYLQNPWLQEPGYSPKELKWPQRTLFDSLYKDILDTKQVTGLVGLRRTGKSTLLKQILGLMLKNPANKNRILYFSFDEFGVEEKTETLESVIKFFLEEIVDEKLHKIEKPVYLFLDEIQLIPYWQDIVKRFYDLNQKLKFIVSGSSSLYILKKSKESLAGRIFEKRLGPLSFGEYKIISGRKSLEEFLRLGQFPELLELNDLEKRKEYLKEAVIKKVIETDIPKILKIRKQFDFERLFWSILPNTGQIISPTKLGSDLSMKKGTLFNYLSILEEALLVSKIVNLSGSFRSEKRLLRKYYPGSSNFLSLSPENLSLGFFAENYIANLLKQQSGDLYLFNERGKEIDFVIPERKLAIEVKYQDVIHKSDYQFLKKYCDEKGYRGVVICKDKCLIKEAGIDFVPLGSFSL